jgi:hypothetical protein
VPEADLPEYVAEFRGSVRIRTRIRNYGGAGTLSGKMSVFSDCLKFEGVGLFRFQLREYVVKKSDVGEIRPASVWSNEHAIRILSKPAGAFNDRDEFTFGFDTPTVDELLAALRDRGYPLAQEDR